MIYNFFNKKLKIVTLDKKFIKSQKHKINILAGFFDYSQTILKKDCGYETFVLNQYNSNYRYFEDVYILRMNTDDTKVSLNFLYGIK